jgi:predicted DNA-binding transcriptional regulator YafY
MPTSPNQRKKLLYLMKILLEKTDEEHPLTVKELIGELSAYDIGAEKKSIYSDIEQLREFGIDIETVPKSKAHAHYVASRLFELPELKILIDAVQTSRLITQKKSKVLINKLTSLASAAQAKQLNRQVFLTDQPKAFNEDVYYIIDAIHTAINEKKKLRFKYFDYDIRKNRVYRRNGEVYIQTPLALCWNEDNYYLIAHSEKYDALAHYRVDRMSGTEVMKEAGAEIAKERFNAAVHARQVFGMYSGKIVRAHLAFAKSLVNTVLDRFGKDTMLFPWDDDRFAIQVDVANNPVLLAWLFQFGDDAEILAPAELIESMRDMVKKQSKKYDK